MSSELSRRELIASGAAGTAGALGIAACNTTSARQLMSSQDPGAPQATMLFQKVKPFLAQQFSTNPPAAMRGSAKFAQLYAWAREQLERNFNPRMDYGPAGALDPVANDVFDSIQRSIEDQILASQVWSQVVQPNQAIVVYPADRDKFPGPIPPQDPPIPPPGEVTREARL